MSSNASAQHKVEALMDSVKQLKGGTPSIPSTDNVLDSINPALPQHFESNTKSNSSSQEVKSTSIPQNLMAELVSDAVRNSLAWDHVTGSWYQRPEKTVWKDCAEPDARISIRRAIEKHIGGYTAGYLAGVMKFLQDDLYISAWNTDRHLLPVSNGVVDIHTRTLFEYSKKDRFNWQLPYEFDPEAKCPTIEKIVRQMAGGNNEFTQFLFSWLYVVLTGRYELQKYLELIGPGGTGKSTFLKLAEMLVGIENRAVTELKELEGNRFESSGLYGKRLTLVADSSQHRGEVSQLKKLTGGDAMRNEVKNRQQSAPFIYMGLVMVAANEPIQSSDYTSGLSRRRIPANFDYRITDADKAQYPNGVESVIADEMPGLLNKLLAMDANAAINTIRNPGEHLSDRKLEVELETNPLLAWADENLIQCESPAESQIGTLDHGNDRLYSSYHSYCLSTNKGPLALERFSGLLVDVLQSHGIATEKRRRSSGRVLTGLRVRLAGDTRTKPLLSGGLR